MPNPGTLRAPIMRRLLSVLADGAEHSTLDIQIRGRICDVSGYCRMLRGHGWDVPRRRHGPLHYWRLSEADLSRLVVLEREQTDRRITDLERLIASRTHPQEHTA